jgi:hypothetical protein
MANTRSMSGDPLEGTSLAGFANFLGPEKIEEAAMLIRRSGTGLLRLACTQKRISKLHR